MGTPGGLVAPHKSSGLKEVVVYNWVAGIFLLAKYPAAVVLGSGSGNLFAVHIENRAPQIKAPSQSSFRPWQQYPGQPQAYEHWSI